MRNEEEEKKKWEDAKKMFEEAGILASDKRYATGGRSEHMWPEKPDRESLRALLTKHAVETSVDPQTPQRLLGILDMLWMAHLENLEALSESVGLRAYGQKDPLVEYRQESRNLYADFWDTFDVWVFMNIFRFAENRKEEEGKRSSNPSQTQRTTSPRPIPNSSKIGRNDPCPCGAVNPATGKVYKYKKCGMINAPHHRKD